MMDQEWRCGECGAERNVCGGDGECLNFLPELVAAKAFGQEFCGVVWGADDDARRGCKRKLKSRIPNNAGFRQNDEEQRDA